MRSLGVPAEQWLHDNVGEEASWLGAVVAVEMRYLGTLAGAIIPAGFDFERDPLTN